MRVWWIGGVLPPTVFVGKPVMLIGKVTTFDGGNRWQVNSAIPLTGKWREIMRPVFQRMAEHSQNPLEWIPDLLDRFKRGRYKRGDGNRN